MTVERVVEVPINKVIEKEVIKAEKNDADAGIEQHIQ